MTRRNPSTDIDQIRNYLLGRLPSEPERDEVEERMFSDDAYHELTDQIEDDLIEDYLDGRLTHQERVAFEAHFLQSPTRSQRVQISRTLRSMFSSSESPGRNDASQTWFTRMVHTQRLTVGAVGIAAALLIAVLGLLRQLDGMRRDRDRLEQALNQAQERSRTSTPPVFYALNQSRAASEVHVAVEILNTPRWLVFSLSVDTSEHSNFRAMFVDGGGRTIWHQENIRPSSPDTLAITVLSTSLSPGLLRFRVEAQTSDQQWIPAGDFLIQATQKEQPR